MTQHDLENHSAVTKSPHKLKPIIETPAMDKRITVGGQSVTVELPLRITVEIGEQRGLYDSGGQPAGRATVETAVQSAQKEYGSLPGVANIRSGLHLVNGQYSKEPAVIICIDYRAARSDATIASLPRSILSLPIQVRAASPEDLLRAKGNLSLESVPRINYVKPPDLSLDAVEDEMFAVFHVSPDAGFPQLKEFLSRTGESLTIGLYNFGTEHVEAALVNAVSADPKTFDFVLGDAGLDRPETDEFEARLVKRFTDLMGDRFRFELADGRIRLFAGHYHIKVAVRDKEAFWLSSGNWEPSNQPDVDPVATGETSFDLLRDRNREWHAVVLNEKLAKTFEEYIKYDLESYREVRTSVVEAPPVSETTLFLVPTAGSVQEIPAGNARYFPPLFVRKKLRIRPLLTPDNYIDHVQPLVESATESIDLQNQTLKWRHTNVDPRFEQLMNTILEKHHCGVRVRFILRSDFSPEMKELLVEHGFESDQVRLLSKCHTKGIIVDSRRTLIGSHNLSEHGAFVNRDASLIIDDEEVANYFKQIFQFDWDRASTGVRETPPGISIYHPGDPIPQGYEVISLEDSVR